MEASSLAMEGLPHLGCVEGETVEDKLWTLLRYYVVHHLQECEREIGQYEIRYGRTFEEFVAAWKADEIPDRWSHPVERDYMEWEGWEAEKRKWLSVLRDLSFRINGWGTGHSSLVTPPLSSPPSTGGKEGG